MRVRAATQEASRGRRVRCVHAGLVCIKDAGACGFGGAVRVRRARNAASIPRIFLTKGLLCNVLHGIKQLRHPPCSGDGKNAFPSVEGGGFFIRLFMSRLKTFLLLAGGLMVLLGAVCWYQFSRDRYIVRLYDTEDRYIAKMSYSFDDYYREHQIAPWLRWYWTVDANTAYSEWIYAAQDTPIAMKLLGKWDWKFLYCSAAGTWSL